MFLLFLSTILFATRFYNKGSAMLIELKPFINWNVVNSLKLATPFL